MKHPIGADPTGRHRRRGRLRRGRDAFSLVELMVAVSILSIVLLAFGATVAASNTQRTVAEERRIAEQILASYLEELRSQDASTINNTSVTLARWHVTHPAPPAPTDPYLVNVTRTLDVFRAEPTPIGLPNAQSEDHDGLGFPVDINGDGDTSDTTVVPADCLVVPARLRLTWTSAVQQTLEVRLYVYLSSF